MDRAKSHRPAKRTSSNNSTNTRPRAASASRSLRRGTIRRLSTVLQKALSVGGNDQDEPPDMGSMYVRYRPESLHHLCNITKFSKKELQLMYRGFKQGCPNGAVSMEQFKEIYAQIFPQGESHSITNTSQYAIHVFNTFDKDKNGRISFEEFVVGLSTISRGSMEEKLSWIFELYDVDGDGVLTKRDMERIIGSVYAMMGPSSDPPVEWDTVQKHVDYVFQKMDKDEDGMITLQEFLAACQNDEGINQSIQLFDTYLL